jgi:hypothetical protein
MINNIGKFLEISLKFVLIAILLVTALAFFLFSL